MKTACVAFGSGCPRSKVNIVKLYEYFRLNDFETVESPEDADVLVTGVCAVDVAHENESFRLLDRLNGRRKPGGKLVLMSCLPGICRDKARERFPDMYHISEIDDVIKAKVMLKDVADPNLLQDGIGRAGRVFSAWDRLQSADKTPVEKIRRLTELAGERLGVVEGQPFYKERGEKIFSIKIGKGCLEECTYCAIRFDSGVLQSKPMDRVLTEFEAGVSAGYRNYELLLDDVGAYGQDIGTNFTELLSQMISRTKSIRLKLTDVGPQWAIRYYDGFRKVLGEAGDCIAQVMLPLQSGSDSVLKRMKRRYTANEVKDLYMGLRKEFPDLFLVTHVIVGFPGETEADFMDTLNLLRDVKFNHIGVYRYGDRPGTEASMMPDKLPEEVIRNRQKILSRELR